MLKLPLRFPLKFVTCAGKKGIILCMNILVIQNDITYSAASPKLVAKLKSL